MVRRNARRTLTRVGTAVPRARSPIAGGTGPLSPRTLLSEHAKCTNFYRLCPKRFPEDARDKGMRSGQQTDDCGFAGSRFGIDFVFDRDGHTLPRLEILAF
jgi:hypothetical protein